MESLKLVHSLRAEGLVIDYSLTPAKADKQFKRAQELRAAHTIRIQRTETGELVAKVKNLSTREEKTLSLAVLAQQLRNP